MDHRTTSQEASPNGHQKADSAAPSHTPTRDSNHTSMLFDRIRKVEHDNNQAAATIYALREELRAAYERISELESTLCECRVYIEGDADVIDGANGEPRPNVAMSLCSSIDESLFGPGAF